MKGYLPINEIFNLVREGKLDSDDLIELSPFNPCLFAYTSLKLPFKRFSPMQERILDTFYNPIKRYKELELVCGRKSGKSLMSSIILLYEAYKMLVLIDDPHEYYGLPSKKKIYFQLVASNREQAQDINFDYIRSFASTSPYLSKMIVNQTNDELEFEKKLAVKVYNCSARSIRGESSAVILFDEIAHWIDNRGNLSGNEVYYAAMPNLKVLKHESKPADSRSVLLTSPGGRQGIAWDLFRTGNAEHVVEKTLEHGEEPWRCVFQCPTWLMNPKNAFNCLSCKTPDSEACHECSSNELRIDWKKNKDKFAQEYAAEFCDTVNPALNKENVMGCISKQIMTNLELPEKEIPRVISLDPALTGNAYALVMAHMDANDVIQVDLIKSWQAIDRDHPIQLKFVEEYIEKLYNNFYITHIILDQYQSASTVQSLQNKGIPAFIENTTSKSNMDAYERLIKRINADPHGIRYPEHKTLLNELCFLQRKVSGKTVRYEASINSTDDISDALAKAVMIIEREGSRRFVMERL